MVIIPVPLKLKSAMVMIFGWGNETTFRNWAFEFVCRGNLRIHSKRNGPENLTSDLGPITHLGLEAEGSAILRPYLSACTVVYANRNRGDGNIGSASCQDIERDTITHDAGTTHGATYRT
jgi:hypothetical protein